MQREDVPPIVGSLFSWKSLFTKRITSEDYVAISQCLHLANQGMVCTFPTAASPSSTNLTLLLGFGAGLEPESAIVRVYVWR